MSQIATPARSKPDATATVLSNYQLDQLKLLYDYIKFHIGLYVVTPPIVTKMAESLSVLSNGWTQLGLLFLLLTCVGSGALGGWFMTEFVNVDWSDAGRTELIKKLAFARWRRWGTHLPYYVGLAVSAIGILFAHYRQLSAH
jgi:hypothetical protein